MSHEKDLRVTVLSHCLCLMISHVEFYYAVMELLRISLMTRCLLEVKTSVPASPRSMIICKLTSHFCIHAECFKAKTAVLPNGLMQDEFEKTSVNMSTYLVAFIVAEFTSLSQNVSETLVCPTLI